MGRLELPPRRAALGGRVTDARTGLPLPGTRVEIVDAPPGWTAWAEVRARELAARTPPAPPPGTAVAGADGWFRFLDLPPGRYTVAVSVPTLGSRYAAARTTAEVAGGRGWADASTALAPTTVAGRVVDADGEPFAMAEVRVKGSLETAVTDADGRFRIVGVEAGARVVTASARGFHPASAQVALTAPGDTAEVELSLSPS